MLENIYPVVKYVICRHTYENWKIDTRSIQDHELVFVIAGKGIITINDKDYPVKENDVIYFYPGLEHSLKTDPGDFMIFYGTHFDLNNNMDKLPLPNISHIPAMMQMKRLLSMLDEVYTKKPYMHQWKQNILLQDILYEIFSVSRSNILPINVQRINQVIHYIHENPYKKFSLSELTQIAGIKKTYFIRMFKEITKQTPMKYTMNLKLEHSKNMLINTSLPIKEIAVRCGFDDEFYYSRMFRSSFGISPKTFRTEIKSF